MGNQMRVTCINRDNGEELDGVVVYYPRKVENQFGRFQMINQDAMLKAINELNSTELKVLLACVGLCDYNNELRVTQRFIAEVCGMSAPNASKAIKGLISKGYICKERNFGGCKGFRLMPQVGWKGKARGHKEALKRVGQLHA